jgi:biotin-dependent carboxylase-like uncharacterized protein
MSAGLVVEKIGPGATVQDRGRPGWMHQGVAPGGPLDPVLFERVRRSLGNAPDTAAIEVPWHGARFRAVGDVTASVDGEPRVLCDGESLDVPADAHAVRYVGLRGGVDVPVVLGGRGTLLVASLGGLGGRMLRRGDFLRAGDHSETGPSPVTFDLDLARVIDVRPGPDHFDGSSLEALFSSHFTVSAQVDRVGMRLRGDGVRPPGDATGRSRPMVRGAIEVTPDGGLIVLGPDHPTTGGYPVIGVVTPEGCASLAQRRPGATVRFRPSP